MTRARALSIAVLSPLLALALLPTSVGADNAPAAAAFDAANLSGGCAALELTVSSGYQFVVRPDVQVPRATTLVQEGASEALASPADPGDSVDALAGLFVPQAEGYIANGYPGAPPPFAGQGLSKLPAPFNSVGQAVIANPFNKALTYPYEHADAGYPNAQRPGPQSDTVAGAPTASMTDPSGILSLNAGVGTANAGEGYAVSDGGAGVAAAVGGPPVPAGVTSVAAFGITIGRVSAHSEAHVAATAVTHDAACALHDIEIDLPGAPKIHIGAVDAALHTERTRTAVAATGSARVEFAGVTVDGRGATLDQHGLTIAGQPVPLPVVPTPAPVPTPGLPGLPAPSPVPATTAPSIAVTGTELTQKQPSPNEMAMTAVGATITISSIAPVPNAIPPSGVSTTPTVYTLRIASLASEAYGLPAAPSGSGSPSGLAGGFAGLSGGGLGVVSGGSGTVAGTPGHAGRPAVASTLAAVTITPAQRWLILGLASLVEALLLVTVGRNYLRSRRVVAPVETTDLP